MNLQCQLLISVVVALWLATGAHGQDTSTNNVLLIVFDDLNLDLGVYGHPDAITPNLDAFAKRAIRFDQAHCNGPFCAPSRTSFIHGLYPSSTGIYGGAKAYESPELKNLVSMFAHFKEHNYDVYGAGKIYHGNWPESIVSNQFTECYRTPKYLVPQAYFNGKPMRHPGNPRIRTKDSPNGSWGSLSNVPSAESYGPGWEGWGKGFRYVDENDRRLLPDEESTGWAVERIKRSGERPFFMSVGYLKPHTPLVAPKEFIDLYEPSKLKMKPVLANDLNDVVPAMRTPSMYTDMWERIQKLPNPEETWRDYYRAYLACISYADDEFGKLMKGLEESGHADDTIVIVTSDHGYHFGDKQRIGKGTPWNGTTRIPLLIRVPGVTERGEICRSPVSLVDLYPTLIDLCHLPQQPHGDSLPLDGYSWKPLLSDVDAQWDGPSVAYNNCYENVWTVSDGKFRYVVDLDGNEELYNLIQDPHEWHNLARSGSHADVRAEMKNKLLELSRNQLPRARPTK